MLAEIGQISLIAALLLCVSLGVFPLLGAHKNHRGMMAVAPLAVAGQFAFVLLSFAILTYAFISQDFSIEYVARHSNSRLPMIYRISAVWSAHEGSLLLWVLILSSWTFAVSLFSRTLPEVFRTRVLGILGWIITGFLLFILYTSNPFGRILPAPAEGLDLNPLLQDPGLIIHPPMLYMGYVGFSVAFAFAVAALLGGQVNRDWVRWSRPWTHVAWAFLTIGIVLGSWWAYYELGWGGWWFWDPVENASFMPWLVGTALIHSQAVTEKRGAFRNWTLLLAIAAFSFSLLGTFLVRSGVITSVHAFASDPTRGVFILGYLGVVTGGSLLLFGLRAPRMMQGSGFAMYSRESLLLFNNLILAVMTAMVLTGTLYPLLLDALDAGKISVGAPYFGTLFALLMIPLVILLPLGAFTRWKQDKSARTLSALLIPFVLALLGGLSVYLLKPEAGLQGVAGVAGGVWLIFGSLYYLIQRIRKQNRLTPPRSELAMTLAHVGVGVFLIGVSLTNTISDEKHLRMNTGDRFDLAGYDFEFQGTQVISGPNYTADQGEFIVYKSDQEITRLYPQKRHYLRSGQPMTEAAIDPGLTRDIYVSLGEPLDDSGAWAVRLYHKPFVRWIWLGGLMMALAGLIAASDRRYRKAATNQKASD